MKVKEESKKGGLRLNIQKTKILASCPITSWQMDGENLEAVTGFILLGFKISTDSDCRYEIKRQLFLGRKAKSWTIKKTEHPRIDAFELWCSRRLLRVPWTARRSNQSILKEINPQYSLEGLMMKLQYFGHLMQKSDSLEKTDTGKDWRQKEKRLTKNEMVRQHHRLNGHELEQTGRDSEGQGSLACWSPWSRKELDTNQWLNNKTTQ